MQSASRSFAAWLRNNAAHLDRGHELLLPLFLAHPRGLGFADAGGGERSRAWTLDIREGRIVVDEYAHGQCIARLERAPTANRARGVTAALDAVVDVAESGAALFARGLVELGARLSP